MADLEPVPAIPEEVLTPVEIAEAPVVVAVEEVRAIHPKVARISPDGVVLSKCEFSPEGVILKVLEE